MPSGRETITQFIEKYKELQCLWKVSDKNYKNKYKRLDAMEQLKQILKKTDENANMDTVTKKINSLRSSFNKEYNKVKASYKSGTGADEVHVPKLWYYDLLLFLPDKDDQRGARDSDAALNEATTDSQDSQNFEREKVLAVKDYVPEPKKSRLQELLQGKSNSFGEYIGEQLEQVDEFQRHVAEKLISEVLFLARRGHLDYSTVIESNFEQPPVPQYILPVAPFAGSSDPCEVKPFPRDVEVSMSPHAPSTPSHHDIKDEPIS